MNRKLYLMMAMIAALAVAVPAVAAPSGTTTRTAPYYWDSEDTMCAFGEGECVVSADANRATGQIVTSAERGSKKLTFESGLAQAHGIVADKAKPSTRSRSVTGLVTFRVDRSTATLNSTNSDDLGRTSANALLTVACSGCPDGGWRTKYSVLTLTDTDPGTSAPETLEGAIFTLTVRIDLDEGQKFNGGVFLDLSVTSQGQLETPGFVSFTSDRRAASSADVTVTSIQFTS